MVEYDAGLGWYWKKLHSHPTGFLKKVLEQFV